jgi:hypothetical protein
LANRSLWIESLRFVRTAHASSTLLIVMIASNGCQLNISSSDDLPVYCRLEINPLSKLLAMVHLYQFAYRAISLAICEWRISNKAVPTA